MMLKILKILVYISAFMVAGVYISKAIFFDGDRIDIIIAFLALISIDIMEIGDRLDKKD